MTVSPVPITPVQGGGPAEPLLAPSFPTAARTEPAVNTSVVSTTVERACAVVAAFALLAFIVKLAMAGQVIDQRREVAERQARIASASVLAQVNNRLIQMLATASAEQGDQSLRDLLSRSGVSFSIKPNPPQSTTSAGGVQP
jgi:hypothetical protein